MGLPNLRLVEDTPKEEHPKSEHADELVDCMESREESSEILIELREGVEADHCGCVERVVEEE